MRVETLRKEIAIGLQQLAQAEYTDYDEASVKEILEKVRVRGRQRLADHNNQSRA